MTTEKRAKVVAMLILTAGLGYYAYVVSFFTIFVGTQYSRAAITPIHFQPLFVFELLYAIMQLQGSRRHGAWFMPPVCARLSPLRRFRACSVIRMFCSDHRVRPLFFSATDERVRKAEP